MDALQRLTDATGLTWSLDGDVLRARVTKSRDLWIVMDALGDGYVVSLHLDGEPVETATHQDPLVAAISVLVLFGNTLASLRHTVSS